MISRPARFWKAIALYFTTSSAESWGTAGDYVRLFLTAFGVSGGTQSFAVVLQALRH
jgi:hypothetical protein